MSLSKGSDVIMCAALAVLDVDGDLARGKLDLDILSSCTCGDRDVYFDVFFVLCPTVE